MARSKYNEDFPLLAEGYAREGFTDEQIAAKLGVSKPTFYEYQKRYPDFFNSIKRGKAPVDTEVENSLLRNALGFEYEETTQEIRIINGKEYKTIRKTKKFVVPSTTAQIFWLKNRKPHRWRDKQEILIGNDVDINVSLRKTDADD